MQIANNVVAFFRIAADGAGNRLQDISKNPSVKNLFDSIVSAKALLPFTQGCHIFTQIVSTP